MIDEDRLLGEFPKWDSWHVFASEDRRRLWARAGHREFRVEVNGTEMYRGASFAIAAKMFAEPYGCYEIRKIACVTCDNPLKEMLLEIPYVTPMESPPAKMPLMMTGRAACSKCTRQTAYALLQEANLLVEEVL